MNFKVNQFKRIDGEWGLFDKGTGQWNGLVSNLVKGEADMITASLNECCMRRKAVDFIWPLSSRSLGFAIKSNDLYFYQTFIF